MNQAIKDRLFALGIEIPAKISAGDNPSIQRWAERTIAEAEAAGAAPSPEFAGDAFYEVVTAGDVDLLALLRLVNEAALELAELAIEQGDQAVYDRIGVPPEWPGLRAWVESVVTPAAAADDPGAADETVEEFKERAVEEERQLMELAETAELIDLTEPETEPPPESGAPVESHTPEELIEIAAKLGAREDADAAAREGAEVTTSVDGEGGAEKLPIELLNMRLGALELRVEDQESQGKDQWAAIEANTNARIAPTE